MVNTVVIPTRFGRATLRPLVQECLKVAEVILVHTEPGHAPVRGTTTVRSSARNIHTWWNAGLDLCSGPALVLNDDVSATAADLRAMFAALIDADLVYIEGRTGPAPLSGWCYGLHPSKIRPDESFIWWYGDDDLHKRAERDGLKILALHLDIQHHHAERFGDPAMEAAAEQDANLYRQRWG